VKDEEDEDDRPRRPRKRRRDPDEDDDYEEDDEDDEDDRPRRRRRAAADPLDDPAMAFIIPVHTSGLAIAAGYMGLFSVLCLPAPIALLLGLLALRELNRKPKLHGRYRAIFAIVMGAIFSFLLLGFIVLAIIQQK
jgi:hypothetical protein